jgi:hypothetical protein
LVLLAVLMPLRGAVAACMLCPDAGSVAVQAHHDCASARASARHPPQFGPAVPHAPSERLPAAAAGVGHADKCPLCAMGTAAALATVPRTLFDPIEPGATVFPTPASPPLSFVSARQDRPPRSS